MEGHDTIVPPSPADLDYLRHVVLFRKTELDERLQAQGGSNVLQPLTSAFGATPATYNRHNGALLAAPLVQHGTSYVVALPGLLLEATRHQLISRGIDAGAVEDLSRRFSEQPKSQGDPIRPAFVNVGPLVSGHYAAESSQPIETA